MFMDKALAKSKKRIRLGDNWYRWHEDWVGRPEVPCTVCLCGSRTDEASRPCIIWSEIKTIIGIIWAWAYGKMSAISRASWVWARKLAGGWRIALGFLFPSLCSSSRSFSEPWCCLSALAVCGCQQYCLMHCTLYCLFSV